MFASPLYEIADGANQDVPRNDPVTQFSWDECRGFADISSGNFIAAAEEIGVPILVGADTAVFDTDQTRRYASSVFVNVRPERNGQGVRAKIESRYDKMHPVMFGEYVPLGDVFPALYDLTPLDGGVDPGQAPRSIPIGPGGAMRAAPNICYENVLPHLIGRQVRTLRAQGAEPELLISQSNDGWFWGSAELDLHLICAVFRAVECRKPLLIAANTGFSAWIDGNGKIVKQGPRHAAAVLLAEPKPDARTSWYLDHGDLPVQLCAACCAVFALAGCWYRFRPRDADAG
jgi:apolipoprotein N-acyltransferase